MRKTKEKIFALTLTATSIVSIMPVYAAQFIEDNNASIKNAITYKDGKYLYEGYKGESDYGVYYNDGINDIKLEDVDDLDEYAKFKTNYVTVPDGNGEQSINLENGQVSEDISKEVSKDEAQSRLESKLKRSKKYGNDFELVEFNEIENNIASDEQWYSYVAKGNRNYDASEDEVDETEEYTSEIKVRLNYIACSLKIAGVTFEPAWGDNMAENLVEKLNKVKLKDGYFIKSAQVITVSNPNNDGDHLAKPEPKISDLAKLDSDIGSNKEEEKYVEFVLGINEEVNRLPEGVVVFIEKDGQEEDITKLKNPWKGNFNVLTEIKDDNTSDEEIITKLQGNWDTEINVSVNGFWGPLVINGVEIETSNAINTVENINKTDFGSEYEVIANLVRDDNGNEKAIITIGTNKEIKTINDIAKDFIKFNGNNVDIAEPYGVLHDADWAVAISNMDIKQNIAVVELQKEWNTEINVSVNGFWGPLVINGVEIQTLNARNTVENINKADFGSEYEVVANLLKEDNGHEKAIITIGTNEKIGDINDIAKDFIKFNGNNVDVVESYGTLHDIDWAVSISNTDIKQKIKIVELQKEWNTEIKAFIGGFWGPLVINGVEIQTLNAKNTVENINKADFGSEYEVVANLLKEDNGNEKVMLTIGTNEIIKDINDIPQDFIKFNGNNVDVVEPYGLLRDVDWAVSISNTDIKNNHISSGSTFRYVINSWYGTNITIDGQMIAEKTGNITEVVEQVKKELDGMTFSDLVILSCSENNGNLEIILESTKNGKSEAPKVICSNQNNTTGWEIPAEEIKQNTTTTSSYSIINSQDRDDSEYDENEDSDDDKVLYFGFTDGKGNYIDCTKTANLRVFNGYDFVRIKEFNSSKESHDIEVEAGLPSLIRTLGQDNDYIYCVISVPVTNYQPGTGEFDYNEGSVTDLKYIQKISKAKRDTTDGGAYIPKSVNSYQIYADSSDWNYYYADNLFGDENNEIKTLIIDGRIYYVKESSEDGEDKVVYGKVNLKGAEKVTLVNLDGEQIKESFPLVKHDSASETEADDWCIDFEGSVWAINSGEVLKSRQATDFQTIYECDNSFDKINAYDSNNFIVWNEDTEGYATYLESEKVQEPVKLIGWNKLSDGTWHLYDAQGNETKGWTNYNSCWYYFNNDGVMQTGWIEDNGQKYYLSHSGVMQRGWISIEDKWYYLDQSGVMKYNTAVDGYNLDENGVWIQ